MTRIRVLALVAACLLILFAGGCSVAASVGESKPSGGELRFAIRADPKTLDPHVVVDEPSQVVQYLTAGVLIRQNRLTQELEPALATQWKVAAGGDSIEFRLRTGVRFSDGSPFTAEDVEFTIARINDRALHSPYAETLRSGPGEIRAEVRSPYQVIVRVPARVANLPGLFDQISIVSAKPRNKAATLGPFEIAEYKPGSYLLLNRNPHYWKKDAAGQSLPYLASVRLDIQANRELELLRFRRGEVQLVNGIDAESFERLASQIPDAVRDLGPSLDSEQFWFNQVATASIPDYKRQWFRTTEFRRAISLAINRSDICRLVYRGHASPAGGPVSSANRFWNNAKLSPAVFSPKAALVLLMKSGFRLQNGSLIDRDGHAVEFSVITNAGSKSRERMATLIQQDLAKIGIRLNVVPMDFPSLIERITRTFQYEACLLGQVVDLDPNEMMNVWRSSAPNHQWNPNQRTPETEWEAEMDRLMLAQAAAIDPQKRKAAYDRVQQIVAEQLPFIYLVHKDALVGVSSRLGNVHPAILQPQTFWNVDTITLSAPASH
jgi:peptide/nickel transport system substrate-binding protein